MDTFTIGTRVRLTHPVDRYHDYDLRMLGLALRGYVEGLDGEYDDDHIHMDKLAGRIKQARRRLARRST